VTADQTWHAQMQAVHRGDWDAVPGYFTPDCTWTLMPPGTTFRESGERRGGTALSEMAGRDLSVRGTGHR
jgi:ketosteroid isomerase-like protein